MEARHEERYTREQWTWLAWGTLGSQMGWQRARVWGSHVGFHVTMRLVRMGCDLGDVRVPLSLSLRARTRCRVAVVYGSASREADGGMWR
jgi:hypothetical protein